ncbi:enoyl-CoA hydratase/isomerase family protein [Martelella soudanensis]|uniref:enoyl-CoA hydratase/isomerase family protein n=1 Tax=unclassified Martelella TaxID=2629616 RepID=UPI0015DE235F|nr:MULTISPECIES: enoyl-CoA hydratase/isomerase family protein [unclassified Martelella]
MATNDIHIRNVGRTGRITLSRPQALNALNHEMTLEIEHALDHWSRTGDVDMILIDAEGERAFCAGGDLSEIYQTGREGDFSCSRSFWADEYRMNALIAGCATPYVALMDGIVMGGGAGISAHGSHRIVTERSMIAMPECGIGLVPDVGCSFVLARAPGHLGEFLAMTGWRMNDGDAIFSGFADIAVNAGDLAALKTRLEETADPDAIDAFERSAGESALARHIDVIERHFGGETALDCLRSLEADDSEFAQRAAAMIRRGCPLAVACAFELVRQARSLETVSEALRHEFRFTYRSMSDGDFLEGIRAQIIDKDRNPKWRITRLEDVDRETVCAMLAPLGAEELQIKA